MACLGPAPPAHASLGQAGASVEGDRAHLAARMATTGRADYTVHVLTLPNGGTVREFARGGDGVVFAVAWRGPGRPDLRQLLGDSFATLQADNVRPGLRRTRMPLTVNRSELVVRSGGHPGAFHGAALLPRQAPAGFPIKELQ